MKKLVLLTFCIALTSYGVFAQQDLTLYELRSAPQSHGLNPSKIPLSKGYVLLPVLSGGYTAINSEGFTLSDAVQPNESTGKLDVTLDKAIDRMKDINSVNFDFRTTVLGFGFRAGAGFASFAYARALDDDPKGGQKGINFGSITEEGEYRDFNRLGLRLDMDLGDNLSFATQAVMRGSEDYEPDFDWIYLSYQINNKYIN